MGLQYFYPARGKALHNLIRFASGVGLVLFGWDAGVIGGIVNSHQFQSAISYDGTEELLTFMVAGILLGDVIGCIAIAPLGYKYGIRRCIIVSCWIGIVGVIIHTAAYSSAQMIVGRILLGIANGITASILPVYMQETAVGSEQMRSRDIVIALGLAVYGLSIANWIDYGVLKSSLTQLWRFPLAMQGLFLLVTAVIYQGLRETPRWLYLKKREQEGDEALAALIGCNMDDPELLRQKTAILAAIALEEAESNENKSMFHLMFFDKSETQIGKRIWVATAVICNNPLYGGNIITFYSASIFAVLNLTASTQSLLTATLQTAAPVGLLAAFWLLPTFGRRPILIYGGIGLTSMMLVFTICTNISNPNDGALWTAIASLFVFQIIWGACYSWMPNLYSTEIVPTRYRPQAVALGNAVYYLGAFVEVYSTPIAIANTGNTKIFIWFCLMGAGLVAVVSLWAKETRGLSLEQIDLLWASESYKQNNSMTQVIEGTEVEKVYTTSKLADEEKAVRG